MPPEDPNQRKHLFLTQNPKKERYTSPRKAFTKEFVTHLRERHQHGQNLKAQVNAIQDSISEIKESRRNKGYREDYGIYIEFESEQDFQLKFESLENTGTGIEVENVREIEGRTYATVYVPDGELKYFINKIDQYIEKNTKILDQPKNKKLIENISSIRLATVKAFWTGIENFDDIPLEENRWWEIWIRAGNDSEERNEIESDFLNACSQNSVTIKNIKIKFPERTVYLVNTSVNILAGSFTILNCLAEIRKPQETAETFMGMQLSEQRDWADDLIRRTSLLSGDLPFVCIIDTGVNNGHPLLEVGLSDSDKLTYNDSWGVSDNRGHGTGMAGLALYGDLFQQLISSEEIQLVHRLESVKLYNEQHSHDPELYGAVTQECIFRSEINAPRRKRIHCLAVSSNEYQYFGRPTSWSAALDQVTFAELDNQTKKRLVLISAGNVDVFCEHYSYPDNNILESIHDPGQSWNSITVGGFTQKITIDKTIHGSLIPVAPKNELAPSSSTSVKWERKWPIKPEVVLEAGNYAKDAFDNSIADPDSLRLLTTFNKPTERLFTCFGDTSAAAAQASRICAIIQYRYPNYWPETLRGLLIHSANWTNEMLANRDINEINITDKRNLLRKYGYGVPDLGKAIWCASNFTTLIIEQHITPFINESNNIKTNEVNFHPLPWPKEFFQELSSVNIKLKITLSYYIEPNPTQRKYFGKYDYASHGLRFDLKKGAETVDEFKRRINKKSRDEDDDETSYTGLKWSVGPNVRNVGSIHSDIWTGTAAALAEMDTVAVFPVSGWWRIRKRLERWDNSVRYSLIVSLEVESPEIDIYTPIYNIVNVPITITT
jgi:hypothetical protein